MTKHINPVLRTVATALILLATTLCASASTMLQKADSAYNANDYRGALTMYNKVLAEQGSSAGLYYNIGNAQYRAGNNGRAIVAYERALRLDPSHESARANLDFVNSMLPGLPEDGSSFLSNIHTNIVSFMSPTGWAIIALALFLVVLSLVALYLFVSNVTVRKIGFFGGLVLLFVFVYAAIIAWQTAGAADRHDVAIVVTQSAKLTTEPGVSNASGGKTVPVPEGSKVFITDSLPTPNDPVSPMWYNIRLNNQTEAWIAATDVERI